MWPAFDLMNRGVFMELGSPRLIGGVLGTEGVQNGVNSDVYEGKREAKEHEGEEKTKEGKEETRKKEKEREIF